MSEIRKKICDNCHEEVKDNHWHGTIEMMAHLAAESAGKEVRRIRIADDKDFCSWGCITEYVMGNSVEIKNGKNTE